MVKGAPFKFIRVSQPCTLGGNKYPWTCGIVHIPEEIALLVNSDNEHTNSKLFFSFMSADMADEETIEFIRGEMIETLLRSEQEPVVYFFGCNTINMKVINLLLNNGIQHEDIEVIDGVKKKTPGNKSYHLYCNFHTKMKVREISGQILSLN